MATLIIRDPQGNESEQALEVGRPVVIGRVEGNDIVLPGRLVSRRHARISEEEGRVFVEDLGSANGTLIDGQPIDGKQQLPPEVPCSIGEYVVFAEADAAPEGGGRALLFTAQEGPFVGSVRKIPATGGTVGRVSANDLAVDHPSVSRRHARFHVDGEQIVLTDLGSSNGTFVNGEPKKQAVIQHGDEVTFGSRRFLFHLEGLPVETKAPVQEAPVKRPKASGPKLRHGKLIIGLAAVVVLLVMVALLRPKSTEKPEDAPKRPQSARQLSVFDKLEEQVASALLRGQAKARAEDWESAIREYQTALDLDPINREAKQALRRAKTESRVRNIYRDGEMSYELGKLREARDAFQKVPRDSSYYIKVKYKLRQINERLGDALLSEAWGFYRADHFRRAYEKFCEYLQIFPTNEKAKRGLRSCSDNMRRLNIRYATCDVPTPSEASSGGAKELRGDALAKALSARYPGDDLRQAVEAYIKGDWDAAIRRMRKLSRSRRASDARKAETLVEDISRSQGHYVSGTTKLLNGDVAGAHADWNHCLKVDEALVPPGIMSYVSKEIRRQLGDAYYQSGLRDFDKERHVAAFEAWSKGYEMNPDHIDILKGIARLEKVAGEVFDKSLDYERAKDGRAKDLWRKVISITLPDSRYHRQAKERLSQYQ